MRVRGWVLVLLGVLLLPLPVLSQPVTLTLAWDYASTGHDGFRLERKLGQTGTYAALPGPIAPSARLYADTTAPSGQIVCYRLAATLGAFTSPWSNETCGAVLVAPLNLRVQ